MHDDCNFEEIALRLRHGKLAVCGNCSGQGYTDAGTSACGECYGAGVMTPEMARAFKPVAASPAPAASADVKEVAELRKFADYVLMWCDRGLPHGGPGNEKTALDAIRWHPALRSRRETLATQPASSVPPASAGQCEIDYVRLIPWEIGEHGVEIVMASGRRVLLPLRSSTALAPAAQVHPVREEIATLIAELRQSAEQTVDAHRRYTDMRHGPTYESVELKHLTAWRAAEVLDAILAARPVAEGDAGWQPIETAPRDATVQVVVVLRNPAEAAVPWKPTTHPAYIDEHGRVCCPQSWRPDVGLNGPHWRATLWQPLAAPPAARPAPSPAKGGS